MNTTRSNRGILPLLTFFLLLGSVFASAKEYAHEKKKEYKQSFSAGPGDQLQVDNRFGNITVTHWGKNEVEIRVTVETHNNNEKRAQADLDRINVAMDKKGNTISAITSMNDSKWNNDNNTNSDNNQITINYYISMPAKLTADLSQKFGNITLPENNPGKCTLRSKFGNIYAGNFTGQLTIESKYGNVDLGNVENAVLDLGYVGSTTIKNAKQLNIDSKYSNTTIGNVDNLQLSNKYGNVKLENVDKASIETKYGDANIALLKNELDAEVGYGSLTIKEVSANFRRITAEARYSNLNLHIPSKAAFRVEAEGMKYGNYDISGFKITNSSKDGNGIFRNEVNNGGQAVIRFEGNSYSNLNIKAL